MTGWRARTRLGRTTWSWAVGAVAMATLLAMGLPVLAGPAQAAPAAASALSALPLSGTVTGPGGGGVAGATVSVLPEDSAEPVATTTTNGDGDYGVPALTADWYRVVVTPLPDDPGLLAGASRAIDVGDDGTDADFALETGTVAGVVSRSDGTPAAGALVSAAKGDDETATMTWDDGSYRLALDAGDWALTGHPPAENPSLDVITDRQVSVPAGGSPVTADLSLVQPNVRGTVYAPGGTTAVAGARVSLDGVRWTTSRSDGSFGFTTPPGTMSLQVRPPSSNPEGWVGYTTPLFQVGSGHTPAAPLVKDLTLRGATLTGVVRTPEGDPVPRAHVHASSQGKLSFGRADDHGRYAVEAGVGDVTLYLYPPGHTLAYLARTVVVHVPEVPFVQDVSFVAPNVVGRVVTADGLPVADATVEALDGGTRPDATTWTRSDDRGRFALLVDPGTRRLRIDPPERRTDAADTRTTVEVPAGGLPDLEIVLDRPTPPAYDLVASPAMFGDQPAEGSQEPVLSADGSTLVVTAHRGNPCDCSESDYEEATVVQDRATGQDELLQAPDGTPIDVGGALAVSADGQRIAFFSSQPDLVPGDDTYSEDLFVLDRAADRIVRIEQPPPDETGELSDPSLLEDDLAMSGDGRRLVVVQERTDPNSFDWTYDVVVISLDDTLAEVDRTEHPASVFDQIGLAASRDGSTVAWTGFRQGSWGLRVLDVTSGTEDPTRHYYPDGDQWEWQEEPPSLSADGSRVAYLGYDHVQGEYGLERRAQLRFADREAGTDEALTAFPGHPLLAGEPSDLRLSADGSSLAMRTPDPELDAGDQAWLVDTSGGDTVLVSRKPNGRPVERVTELEMAGDPDTLALELRDDGETPLPDTDFVHLALGEASPPAWPDDATLTAAVDDIGTTSVLLRWSEATDNQAVVGYRVYRGGELVGTTAAGTRQLRVTGLSPDTSYDFVVQAVDGRGSESTDGPSVTARTRPPDDVELRPLDATPAAGGVVRLEWEAAPSADNLLVRTYLGDTVVDELEVAADATTAEVGDLAADTAYDFEVLTQTGDQTTPYTRRVSATTLPLTLSSVTWTAPTVRSGVVQRGSTALITAQAERGRAVSVTVDHLSWYDDQHQLLDEPVQRSSVVQLTETPAQPGSYTGEFELVDGIARINGMRATVADGHGGELGRDSTRAPARVSSRLVVDVDAPPDTLTGGAVQVSGATTGDTGGSPINGGATVWFDHLRAADDYQVFVFDGTGRQAAARDAVRIRDGLATELQVDPTLPARLTVRAETPQGEPVSGSSAELVDADTGDWLATRTLDAAGETTFGRLLEGQRVQLVVTHPDEALMAESRPGPVVLAGGDNTLEVTSEALPRTALEGLVTYQDGEPAAGAAVTLVQRVGPHTHRETVFTDAQGHYSVSALRREATLSVARGDLSAHRELTLGTATATEDFTLEGPRGYDVSLRLFTRQPGSETETGPIPLDWRTAVHFRSTLSAGGGWANGYGYVQQDGSSMRTVQARPGDLLTWCIDGVEARVVSTCVSERLGDVRDVDLELHAVPAAQLRLRLQDGAGADVPSATARLYRVSGGVREFVRQQGSGSTLQMTVPGAGDYELDASAGIRFGRHPFTVGPLDEVVDGGTLVLREARHFSGPDNVVVAARPEALPGSQVQFRASWRNVAPEGVPDATARIEVPAGAELVPGSVLLDGRPVTPTTGDGYADVPIGDVATAGTGSLLYRLSSAPGATEPLVGEVGLRHGQPVVVERLAPATVRMSAVTITGPSSTAADKIPLSGRAPAGALVTLLDGQAPLGTVVAGPGGFWRTSVQLPERLPGMDVHKIVAQVTVDDALLSDEHVVRTSSGRPVATQVSMFQVDGEFPNGRRVTFDPRDGVARFPFVYVPSQTLVFEVTFDHPELVKQAAVLIGSQRVTATRRSDGVFVARHNGSVSGGIRLDYDADVAPMDMSQEEPTEAEVRDLLPSELSDYETSEVVPPDPQAATKTGSYLLSLPAMGLSGRQTVSVTPTAYEPTAGDLAASSATGSPGWGATWSVTATTGEASMVIPQSAIEGVQAQLREGGLDSQERWLQAAVQRAADDATQLGVGRMAAAEQGVRIGFKIAWNVVSNGDSAWSAWGADEKYDSLSKALDQADGCNPGAAANYGDRLKELSYLAAFIDALSAGFTIAGLVLAAPTFGAGVAFAMAGWALDKLLTYALNDEIDSIKQEIANDPECEDEEDDDEEDDDDDDRDDDDLADPTWIYDPSGYAYEGARSHRVGGVTATLLQGDSADGPWHTWDAEWFGQSNPQATDDAGRYGWDVPEGWWKVVWSKDGYEPATSRVLRVLPPHLDVDVSLVKEGFPQVTSAGLAEGGIEIGFDRLVRSASLEQEGALQVVDGAGDPVTGTWTPVGAATGDGGQALQAGARFVPDTAWEAGQQLGLAVTGAADYAGRVMLAPYELGLTVPEDEQPSAPGAPTGVTAAAGERRATVSWSAPGDGGSPLTGYVVTVVPGGRQVAVGPSVTETVVDGLAVGTAYRFTVTATNTVGTGPASDQTAEVVPYAEAPDTDIASGPAEGSVVLSRTARFAWAGEAAAWRCTLDGRAQQCGADGLTLRKLSPGSHALEVAAVDADGDVDPSPARRTWTVPHDDRQLNTSGAWRRGTGSGAYLGTWTESRKRGSVLRMPVEDVREVVLVASGARRGGTVQVLLGWRPLAKVDLSRIERGGPQVVPVAQLPSAESGTLRIVVRSRGRVVRVDGVGVVTR